MGMEDVDGDGEMDLLAGNRYRGHEGNDPGSYDPLMIYYYKIDRTSGTFKRVPVSIGGASAVGTQFITEDLDGDGDLDIAVAGKTSVHMFKNLKVDLVPHAIREQEISLNKQWPFPSEGTELVIPKKKWFRQKPGRLGYASGISAAICSAFSIWIKFPLPIPGQKVPSMTHIASLSMIVGQNG